MEEEHKNGDPFCMCNGCVDFRTKWLKAEFDTMRWEKKPLPELLDSPLPIPIPYNSYSAV